MLALDGSAGAVRVLAHEAWFVEDHGRFTLQWELLASLPTVIAVSTALSAAVAFVLAERFRGEPRLRWLDPLVALRPAVPRILSVAIGLALAGTAMLEGYLAPSMRLPDNVFGRGLALLEVAIAVLLVADWKRRVTAVLLVLAGPVGMLAYGVRPVLERADLLGAAAFLAIAYGAEAPAPARALVNPVATAVMRVLAAVAIGVLAFTEKLLNPDLARAFLAEHPQFDLFALAGLGDADHTAFITFAATAELTLAALLLGNRLPRLTVVLVGTPFLVTWPLLGAREFVGHLPLYAILFVVLIEAQVRRQPEHHVEVRAPASAQGRTDPQELLALHPVRDRIVALRRRGSLRPGAGSPPQPEPPPSGTTVTARSPDPPAQHRERSDGPASALGVAAVGLLAVQAARTRSRSRRPGRVRPGGSVAVPGATSPTSREAVPGTDCL